MSRTVIQVENVSKRYRLGVLGHQSLRKEFQSRWARLLGKDDPNSCVVPQARRACVHGEQLWALKDVCFDVQEGEVLGIIGRNGSGKSTLLKIISRVTTPTRGVVRLRGRVVSLLEVGTGFHPELTGRENVYLNGAILGMTRDEIKSKFDSIVSFAEIDAFIDTPVKRYSSGMYVRLAFAVAAHLEPEILLVDEVLAVGDEQFQRKCLGKMGSVAKEGRTVLFVSHNMDAVQKLCKSALWLDRGAVEASGTCTDIVAQYLASCSHAYSGDISGAGRALAHAVRSLSSIKLKGPKEQAALYHSGEPLTIEVEFQVDVQVSRKLSLGILIQDLNGANVFGANMSQYREEIENSGERTVVQMRLANFWLTPGTYRVSLFLGDGLFDFDIVENAIAFEVIWDSRSTIQKPPDRRWGPFAFPVQWEVTSVC